MEHVMKEYSSNPKIKTLKLVSVLLMATFLQAGTAHSEGGLGGALGGALGGLGGALGGGSSGGSNTGGGLGGLGNALGGITGGVNNTLNGVTGSIGNTTTKLGALNKSGVLSADAKSDILNGIMAKARVLSPKELARLCLATGGGDSGCGSGNKPRILGLIDARLDVLSNKRLIRVCASVGAGCGGGTSSGAGNLGAIAGIPANAVTAVPENAVAALLPNANAEAPGAAVPANDESGRLTSIAAKLSNSEAIVYKKRCSSVLRNPRAYENDIVQICKLIN
jgi:hypothetical protein